MVASSEFIEATTRRWSYGYFSVAADRLINSSCCSSQEMRINEGALPYALVLPHRLVAIRRFSTDRYDGEEPCILLTEKSTVFAFNTKCFTRVCCQCTASALAANMLYIADHCIVDAVSCFLGRTSSFVLRHATLQFDIFSRSALV